MWVGRRQFRRLCFSFRENPVTGAHTDDVDRVQVIPIKQARDVECVLFKQYRAIKKSSFPVYKPQRTPISLSVYWSNVL